VYRVQFEVAETVEQVFVGLGFKFYSLHPIPYDFEHLIKRISKTKYTVVVCPIVCQHSTPRGPGGGGGNYVFALTAPIAVLVPKFTHPTGSMIVVSYMIIEARHIII
jgi:hypothetical protein